ncbi:MAG: DUF3552 domain-containing protein, partial [Epsilonproteobacteria bacterium]|nr:DUF3552 domain-containing protein [Campylobacterota bacterium]
MIIEVSIAAAGLIVGGLIGAVIQKRLEASKFEVYEAGAKAKAKAIEHEAELVLRNANLKAKDLELEAKNKFEEQSRNLQKEYEQKMAQLEKKDEALNELFKDELKSITKEKDEIKRLKQEVEHKAQEVEDLKKEYQDKIAEALKVLERSAGLTESEAREIVLKKTEENSRAEIAHIVRKYEEQAKQEAKKRANFILAQATTRYAGDYAAERLINVVNLPNDDLKGRIIGKEGRNIKTLEMLLGVDVIIDDTPQAIILSSFNLYRRAIATKVIELLVEDGRIQPARIEDIYKKVKEEFEQSLLEEGQDIVIDMGLNKIHPEIVKLIGRLKFRASYGQNALGHSLEVAHLAGIIAAELGGNEQLAKRAGLLHDIGKALTHDFAGSHVDLGGELC